MSETSKRATMLHRLFEKEADILHRTRSITLTAVRPPQAGETDASDRSDRSDGSSLAKGDLTPWKH